MSSQTVSVGGQSHICHLGPHASHPNRTVTHTKRATCNMSASSHRRQPEWQVACKAYDVDSHAKNRSSSSSATHSCAWEDYDLVILGDGTGATLAAWTFASLGQRVPAQPACRCGSYLSWHRTLCPDESRTPPWHSEQCSCSGDRQYWGMSRLCTFAQLQQRAFPHRRMSTQPTSILCRRPG